MWRTKKRYHCLSRSHCTSSVHTGSEKRVSSPCGRTRSPPRCPASLAPAVQLQRQQVARELRPQRAELLRVQHPGGLRVRQRRDHAERVDHRVPECLCSAFRRSAEAANAAPSASPDVLNVLFMTRTSVLHAAGDGPCARSSLHRAARIGASI